MKIVRWGDSSMVRWFCRIVAPLFLVSCFLLQPAFGKSKEKTVEINQGEQLFAIGKYEDAAKWFKDNEKSTPQNLIWLGKSLEKISDPINAKAERQCFRSGRVSGGTACMNAYAEKLNSEYGAGSFEYAEQMIFIRYTGVHYKKIADEFSKSKFAPEAAYLLLTKNLKGHPDQVMPRIKEYLSKYKSGEWYRKGLLLWARINEDVWWIHRKWSWVLYNWHIAPEELIVKAEPYRQEGLRSFQELMQKYGKTEEGEIAKKEYDLLKNYQDDGNLYGIVNEADVEGTLVR